MNRSTLKGAVDRIDREQRASLVQARWAGAFAQYATKEHLRVLKDLLKPRDEKPAVMSGKQIGAAMRGLVARR